MSTDLDTLDSLEQFQQELLTRLKQAYAALKQPNLGQRNAAQRALEDFRDYSALPDDHLREVARAAINDFLLQSLGDALAGLSSLEQELQAAVQHELLTVHFVAPLRQPRQRLLRALSSLAALQSAEPGSLTAAEAAVSSRKLKQAIVLVKDLLNPT